MNIDRDDEYATRYEAAPPIEEQIAFQRKTFAYTGRPEDQSILASLEKLAALESQPVPVEPDVIREKRSLVELHGLGGSDKEIIKHIDALLSRLQVVQQNEKVWRAEWQQVSETAKALLERAEQAEKDRDACYASLEATRSKLHEITAFVNDNASPQRESEQERDAFARAIRERSAK